MGIPRPCRHALAALAFSFVFVRVTSANASSHPWLSGDLPSPQKDPDGICGRGGLKSAVCDPDGMLSQSDADTIDGLVNFIEGGTHGFNKVLCEGGDLVGAQIAVAIFEKMSCGLCLGSMESRAFQFAKDLHDRWGVGDAKCQNGIVIVFSIKDRAMGFSIGAGVKHIFGDDKLPAVMNVMKTKLRQKQYGQAIVDGVTSVGNILSGRSPPEVDEASVGSVIVPIVVCLVVLGFCARTARTHRRYGQCKKVLEKIDKDRERASNNAYVATSCPICLEDFPGAEEESYVHVGDTEIMRSSGAEGTDANVEMGASSSEQVRTVTAGDGLHPTAAGRAARAAGITNKASRSSAEAVKTLPCGHNFHENCILTWFSGSQETNSQCPICRQPISEPETVESRTNNGLPGGWDVYDPEYSFRMRRTHYYYNDFITWNMIDSWNRDRSAPMATSSAFTQVDPVVVAAAARASGGGGSSFSYGGGSSAGGGGGGGSW